MPILPVDMALGRTGDPVPDRSLNALVVGIAVGLLCFAIGAAWVEAKCDLVPFPMFVVQQTFSQDSIFAVLWRFVLFYIVNSVLLSGIPVIVIAAVLAYQSNKVLPQVQISLAAIPLAIIFYVVFKIALPDLHQQCGKL